MELGHHFEAPVDKIRVGVKYGRHWAGDGGVDSAMKFPALNGVVG